ncbi:adenylyl cyclase-associated protein 2 isoform X2 [Nematostella vectensis]|uniref:adenylyl cyclase-associated protein 2 isoform X2 n=1 Tax=Nematostella vectensis TaxID=45351 RepID=UPI0013900FBB|nr:adenylyl cyclase-associated protein 2 isoform X2 [Nematostella vectensis]
MQMVMDPQASKVLINLFLFQVLNDKLAKFFQLCYEIGGDVKDQAALMKEAFTAQREFLVWVSGRGRQPQDVMSTKLKSTSDKISEVQAFCNSHRGSKQFNHLSGVSEGVAALAWVAAPGKPSSFVKEKCDAAQFYTNRVLKDFKDKEPKHAEWARGLIGALKQLEEYVRDHHSVTLSWGM